MVIVLCCTSDLSDPQQAFTRCADSRQRNDIQSSRTKETGKHAYVLEGAPRIPPLSSDQWCNYNFAQRASSSGGICIDDATIGL